MVPSVELFDSGCQGETMSAITTDQVFEMISQARKGRVNRENLQKFLLNPNGGTGYSVVINFGKTVEQMKDDGHYDWSNSNINSQNFPLSGEGTVNVTLELVHLNRLASSQDVLDHLEANGMRPATVEELLMFGVTYPDIQREFPIVCLGSSWVDPDGDRDVPYLRRDGSRRNLDLDWLDDDWDDVCRFLAVRKS